MKYVALLRGIGPGNPNMSGASLKATFESLGFKNVQPVLASGNVIFENTGSKATAAARIETALPVQLGFTSTAIVRSQSELQTLVDQNPFEGFSHDKTTYLLVTFFRHSPPTMPFKFPFTPDNKPFTILGKFDDAVYGKVDLTTAKTPDYMSWLEKQFGKNITSRTPNTIQLILTKMKN